jgi:transposase
VCALGGGSGRKTDNADAFAVAVAGLRGRDLQSVRPDDVVEILGMLTSRRQELVESRVSTVNRLHEVLCQLIPGGAKKNLRATRARQLLSTVRRADRDLFRVGSHVRRQSDERGRVECVNRTSG